jgi:tetratricopeptide (TPR) repeat protein
MRKAVGCRTSAGGFWYAIRMTFEQALAEGDLDTARALLDDLALLPDTGGLHMPECYADLAQLFDHDRRYDDAITAMERAIEHGWNGRPDGRSDIAEFHLRAGRGEEAARIWEQLKADDPDEVWLYNAAGLSYGEVGGHELAVAWLGEGIELAISADDPEDLVAQLSNARRADLRALGREPDELEQRVDPFLEQRRARERNPHYALFDAPKEAAPAAVAPASPRGGDAAVALSWFPRGEYEQALERWPSLAEDWADTAHPDYCRRLDGHMKWMRAHGLTIRAVAPIVVEDFVAWCEEHGEDPEQARALYAAHRFADGDAIPWPPARNEPCWCGSQRKYKKCCGPAPAAPVNGPEP